MNACVHAYTVYLRTVDMNALRAHKISVPTCKHLLADIGWGYTIIDVLVNTSTRSPIPADVEMLVNQFQLYVCTYVCMCMYTRHVQWNLPSM